MCVMKAPLFIKAGKNKNKKGNEPSCHCFLFHALVVVQTQSWFYSIEKDNCRVILQGK